MSSYWASEDWKVQVKTLESYLFDSRKEGVTSHHIKVTHAEGSDIQFTISPDALGGESIDYKIDGNQVYPAHEAFSKPDESMIVLLRMGDDKSNWRIAKADNMSAYINHLEKLRKAVEASDNDTVKTILQAMREYDAEIGVDDEEEGEDGTFLEIALTPLPPELEALPDIDAYAEIFISGISQLVSIRGKSVDIEGFPMVLHYGCPASDGEWRVTELQSGARVANDDDPALAVEKVMDLVRKYGVEWTQQRIAEMCAKMPPKPTMEGSE